LIRIDAGEAAEAARLARRREEGKTCRFHSSLLDKEIDHGSKTTLV
jgi:hypothetical protein